MAEVSTRRPGSGLFGRSSRAAKENPFDSDEETTSKNPFDDEEGYAIPARSGRTVRNKALVSASSAPSAPSAPPLPSDELFSYGSSKPKASYAVRHSSYEDDEAPTEEYVNQAVQDLERHAVKKSQETTSTLKNALRVANDTMGVGVETLVTLHDQGIQIERTHERAVDLDQHLSRVCIWESVSSWFCCGHSFNVYICRLSWLRGLYRRCLENYYMVDVRMECWELRWWLRVLSMMVKGTLLMCRPFGRRSKIEFVDISESFTSIFKYLDGRALPCGVEGDLLPVQHASWNVAVRTLTHTYPFWMFHFPNIRTLYLRMFGNEAKNMKTLSKDWIIRM